MKIDVDDIEINVMKRDAGDYFSLTNIIKASLRKLRVVDWLRTERALQMMFAWEYENNKNFNGGEFAPIMRMREKQGAKHFKLSVKEWMERTDAIGLFALGGKYGGTYGHRDIALEFAGWVDPFFKRWLNNTIRQRVDGELKS